MICNKLSECYDSKKRGTILKKCSNNNYSICIESADIRSSIKCEEKGKKYILDNTLKNFVISYKVDGGIIVEDRSVPERTNKNDYLLTIEGKEPAAILIELKGVNVAKSLDQIYGSLILLKDFLNKFSHVYGRAIVTSSTPKLKASPEYVKLALKLRQTYKGNIKIFEQKYYEKDICLNEV
jgi:hypothetical protein